MTPEFLAQQREIVANHLKVADAAITTALVPGKRAPILITRDMAEGMKQGAVIVDLAAEQGGNCELSQADQEVVHNGVLILAPTNLAGGMATDASTIYARNVQALFQLWSRTARSQVNTGDEVIAGSLFTHAGEVRYGSVPTPAPAPVPVPA